MLIVGLGNPGSRYARNRHNSGFEVVTALASDLQAPSWREKFHGEFTRVSRRDVELMLLRPMTFMNESGRSVRAAMSFFRVPPEEMLVIHDELDLAFGELRLKMGGGHAGHNGLRSIFEETGTNDFARLRVGIGRPPRGWSGDVADYVLSDMSSEERAAFGDVVERAVNALRTVADKGLAAATNALNKRPKKKAEPEGSPGSEGPDAEGVANLPK